ncbi:MAG: hypothetical protein U5R06_09805 [candidate division KSB1 bacterium]|nr:hypothetical protein [candidate division KSB1 bacterium]
MNPDGSGIQQMSSGQWWHSFGRWSPDGTKIVCNTEQGSTTAGLQIVVMDADGGNRKPLVWGAYMAWHPNGIDIAFVFWPAAELGLMFGFIYLINSTTLNICRVTSDSLEDIGPPCFTPDGEDIYFASNRHNIKGKHYYDIYKMNRDGSNVIRITNTLNGSSYTASVSPTGTKLVYMLRMEESQGSITILDLDSNRIKVVRTPENIIYNYPRWSPDEKYIVFTAVNNRESSIYRINSDGSHLMLLAENARIADW